MKTIFLEFGNENDRELSSKTTIFKGHFERKYKFISRRKNIPICPFQKLKFGGSTSKNKVDLQMT